MSLFVTEFLENPPYGIFVKIEFDAYLISSTIELNPPASFSLIAHFTLELERFVCDHATTIENEELRSKGIAMHL